MLMPLPKADTTARALPAVRSLRFGRSQATVKINGRAVTMEWSRAAARGLDALRQPLLLELELLFSCLVKKSVHVRDAADAPSIGGSVVAVTDRLQLCFRPVTAVACTMDEAERHGRQPVTPVDTPVARQLAPRRVWLDRAHGRWRADYWL